MTVKIKFFSSSSLPDLEETMNTWLEAHQGIAPGIQVQGWQISQGEHYVASLLYIGQDRFGPYGMVNDAEYPKIWKTGTYRWRWRNGCNGRGSCGGSTWDDGGQRSRYRINRRSNRC